MVMIHTNEISETAKPLVINVLTSKYRPPFLSYMEIAVTLGKPEDGRAKPVDDNNAQPNTKMGAALGSDKLLPTSCTNGIMIIAETV